MKVKEISQYLESLCPLETQESYDNCGLQIGNLESEITKLLICLDVTEEVLEQAIDMGSNLIVAHHPLIFSGLKKITGMNSAERIIQKAIANNVSIYAIHTNLDNYISGVNEEIGKRLGLINLKILDPKPLQLSKMIVFIPKGKQGEEKKHLNKIQEAIWNVGGGNIGNYESCSFVSDGFGTFKPLKGANPFQGTINNIEFADEYKLEVIYPSYRQKSLVSTMKANHPYEEPAYDVISLQNTNGYLGAGMIGELEEETGTLTFLHQIKENFKCGCVKYTPIVKHKIKRVAFCGGSGFFLLNKAISQQADVFITADVKYHQYFEAEGKILLADIGHFESEQFTSDKILELLTNKFPNFAVLKSSVNTNPISYL